MASNTILHTALDAVCSVVLEKKSLSSFIYPEEENNSKTKSLVFGTIRYYHQLNDVVSKLLNKSLNKEDLDIHCLMLIGAFQLLYSNTPKHAAIFETVEITKQIDKPWAKNLVNAILREIDRNKDDILAQDHYSHPSWLVKKIKNYYPENYQQIFIANNTQAPMSIRVSPRYNLDKYQENLENIGIKSFKSNIANQALVLQNAVAVNKLIDFDNGSCYVQDLSAQLAAILLDAKDSDLILDACAAPGGKTTHIAENAPNSKIIALDSDPIRTERIEQNANRLNINNISSIIGDAAVSNWWNRKQFDKILLDAPCSATGVIRRHPDIKLLRKPKDITQLVNLQKSILENLWPMLKPGGVLLYATCSILKAENEEQISSFLSDNGDAKEVKINLDWGIKTSIGKQQLPGGNFDGFYYAKIVKNSL